LLSCCLLGGTALAQNNAVKIGVLDDMSGPYAENTGPGDVLAAKFAIADFGGSVLGKPIELVSADFQSKVDVGVGIAKRWYDDENVDMVIGIPNSAIALALVKVAEEKNRIVMPTAAATSALTAKACGPNSIHWIYDTYGQTKTIVNALTKQGIDSWFFITVDYAFGLAIEADATDFIKAAGGKVLGSARHPLNSQDFSAYLVQAQASKAKGLMVANGGNDIINAMKQAAEFGLVKPGMRISAPLMQFPDVHGVGLRRWPGPVDGEPVLLGHESAGARLLGPFTGDGPAARLHPGRHLRRRAALPQGGEGRRHRRGQGGAGRDEEAADQRLHDQGRQRARGRPRHPRHVPDAGQDARGVEGRMGPGEDHRHGAGQRGIPAAGRRRLPAGGKEVEAAARHQEARAG
jgi:hypothetical protein